MLKIEILNLVNFLNVYAVNYIFAENKVPILIDLVVHDVGQLN